MDENIICYKTDSDEHLINIGEKYEPQFDYLTQAEIYQDLNDMMDLWK